jgi:hypothetical protein
VNVQRIWAASGALAVLLFVCGLVFGDLLGSSNYPPLNASYRRVSSYFDSPATSRLLLRQAFRQSGRRPMTCSLRTSTSALIATVRLLRLPGDAEGGEGPAADLARDVRQSVAPPRSSTLALALLVDQSDTLAVGPQSA